MAIATRPKPKTYAKKRQAGHHRRSKIYMKPYSPYLPMLAIVGMGVLVNHAWSSSDSALASAGPALATTRLGLVTGNSSNGLFYGVLLATFLAFTVFMLLNWYRVKRVLNRGEAFMVHHPWFDIGLVFVITAGVVLTRA